MAVALEGLGHMRRQMRGGHLQCRLAQRGVVSRQRHEQVGEHALRRLVVVQLQRRMQARQMRGGVARIAQQGARMRAHH
ncbi:hypothetical protein AB8810_16545 [Xanthomonas sp. NCPPB 3005]|uniref:hypothetical protein n=1 Tax=Xanthomonas sp. NCPPB 3005 TaxID=3240913 RepID=UPI003515019B